MRGVLPEHDGNPLRLLLPSRSQYGNGLEALQLGDEAELHLIQALQTLRNRTQSKVICNTELREPNGLLWVLTSALYCLIGMRTASVAEEHSAVYTQLRHVVPKEGQAELSDLGRACSF